MTSMSVPDNTSANRGSYPLLTRTAMLWTVLLGAVFIYLHWHFLKRMVHIGMNDQNWSHILVVPFISLYYIYSHRDKILATPRRVCIWGLPIMFLGVMGFAMGIMPLRNDMAIGYSMILTLFGMLLLLLGPAMMKILWFPVAFLVFGVKVSDAVWNMIAAKLQTIAAEGSVILLQILSPLTDMDADLRGSTIDLSYMANGVPVQEAMNVAEACSGLRMLMAFLALGVALAFLFPRAWWQRLVMILLAAPIAVFVNVLRVSTLGLLHLIDPSLSHGDFHIFVGMLMLIPAAGLLMLVGWCLEKMIITEGQATAKPSPIPPTSDPSKIQLKPICSLKGLAIGAAGMAAVSGLYLVMLNILTDYKWFDAGPTLAGLGLLLAILILGFMFFSKLLPGKGDWGGQPRLQAAFGVGLGVLLTAGLTQAAMVKAVGIALIKEPIPLRHDLRAHFPIELEDWQLLLQHERLQPDIEKTLGTTKYFTRLYLDTSSGLSKEDVTGPEGDRFDMSQTRPGDIAQLHVAYYTGMTDTVPHVPDVCWLAGGMEFVSKEIVTLNLPAEDWIKEESTGSWLAPSILESKARVPSKSIEAIMFVAADEQGNRNTVIYFFVANGDFVATSHHVRFSFDFDDQYNYYTKVEMQFRGMQNPEEVKSKTEAFLAEVMPEVMACLPDWVEVEAGNYPDQGDAPSTAIGSTPDSESSVTE